MNDIINVSGLRKVFDPRSDRSVFCFFFLDGSVFRCGFLVEFSMSDLQQAAVALPHDGVGTQKGEQRVLPPPKPPPHLRGHPAG